MNIAQGVVPYFGHELLMYVLLHIYMSYNYEYYQIIEMVYSRCTNYSQLVYVYRGLMQQAVQRNKFPSLCNLQFSLLMI